MTSERQATAAEVRKFYKDAGHAVRISRDGHVEYKNGCKGSWLEGRWLEEYTTDTATGIVNH